MPNWCSNGLSVTGGGELLERFAEWLPRCETDIADANRGAGSIWVEETFNAPVVVRGAVCFSFQTAWSPPVKVCDRIAELWPRLRFELDFNEPLQGFRGFCHWSDGRREVEYSEDWDYRDDSDVGQAPPPFLVKWQGGQA